MTVPTFVSVLTFCASYRAWVKCYMYAHTELTLKQSSTLYTDKYTIKIKAKFSYCDQIKINVHQYLNQEHQNSNILLTTNC